MQSGLVVRDGLHQFVTRRVQQLLHLPSSLAVHRRRLQERRADGELGGCTPLLTRGDARVFFLLVAVICALVRAALVNLIDIRLLLLIRRSSLVFAVPRRSPQAVAPAGGSEAVRVASVRHETVFRESRCGREGQGAEGADVRVRRRRRRVKCGFVAAACDPGAVVCQLLANRVLGRNGGLTVEGEGQHLRFVRRAEHRARQVRKGLVPLDFMHVLTSRHQRDRDTTYIECSCALTRNAIAGSTITMLKV